MSNLGIYQTTTTLISKVGPQAFKAIGGTTLVLAGYGAFSVIRDTAAQVKKHHEKKDVAYYRQHLECQRAVKVPVEVPEKEADASESRISPDAALATNA